MKDTDAMAMLIADATAPLHPDLAASLVETEMLGPWIKHPFYNGPATTPGLANRIYEQKRVMAVDYLVKGEIRSLIFAVYERPWRPEALLDSADALSDEDYWALVAEVWIDTEFPSRNWEVWDELLSSERPGREALMEPEDHEVWNHFTKEPVTIYRGVASEPGEVNTDGFSWTTHLPRAGWFARRFAYDKTVPYLVTGEVMRDDVLAYFARRGEHEVLVHPEHVHVTSITELDTASEDRY